MDELVTTVERIDFNTYSKQKNRSEGKGTLEKIPKQIYCDLVTTLNEKCIQTSLLEIWRYREELINSVTQQEIIDAVNLLARSPWYGYDVDYSSFLGGIMKNSSGHIIGAQSMRMTWVLKVPEEATLL